nr:disease resistance protein RPV1-like [Ziziphus jujuba var. spinosa]
MRNFSKPMFSSSSSFSWKSPKKYDVFLSFRGEDTRHTFTGHLYDALSEKLLLYTFKDEDKLEKGKSIAPELLKAIRDSRFSVVILSQGYACSTWCLRELAKIVECMGGSSGHILPIFYHVDPSHVRKQSGSYGDAFKKHEQNSSGLNPQ